MSTSNRIRVVGLFISPGHDFFGHHGHPAGEEPTVAVNEVQGVAFEGVSEGSPCHWMNQAIAPGAEVALHGRGGLRAKILADGWLRTEI